ncbi:hypothetical protein LTR78_005477 [Recurvomyces mirabilis]|uniref:Uncharacterized protein n=1 Tax=Recurvomyces mirabilis TaxID=574656 RepID=A0AAE1C1G9_9PEZI|nr:hypothetical protein LTR78_005477 [Recurvomyces mirabilis]KAK5152615.1 hypothetical protein LTS14_008149 [Recurvomyces mirabilis]
MPLKRTANAGLQLRVASKKKRAVLFTHDWSKTARNRVSTKPTAKRILEVPLKQSERMFGKAKGGERKPYMRKVTL